jgi:hypothetical protein
MRFTQSQVDAYNARHISTRPQEASPQPCDQIDLKGKPTSLEVAGEQALTTSHEIKARGGHVSGVTRGRVNGHWHLSIVWPERGNKSL